MKIDHWITQLRGVIIGEAMLLLRHRRRLARECPAWNRHK